MSLLPVDDDSRYVEMAEVVKRWSRRENPTQIARELGLRRVDVLDYIDEFRQSAIGSEVMRERIEELLVSMDEHYSQLIRKAYEIVDEVDELRQSDKETMTRSQMLSQKKGALDLIAKLEKDRLDILQKAGLLDMNNLGDQLAQLESEKMTLLNIIETELCHTCKPKVLSRLASVLNNNTQVVVVGDTIG